MESIFIKKITFICALAAIFVRVQSGKVTFKTIVQNVDHVDDTSGQGLLLLLGEFRNGRKTINANTLARAKLLYHALTKKLLRQDEDTPGALPDADTKNDDAVLVEHELEDSLSKKSSALQDKPFVQHKGKNDFLVFKDGVNDPFVTVVPNDIYYNVEKRCVNWLDDCNERGIRARLLQRVQSPYR